MKLTDLRPQFLRYEATPNWPTEIRDPATGEDRVEPRTREVYHNVDTIADAQGLMFLCPKCFAKNGGPVRTHQVICWSRSRGVPDDAQPKPGRWTLEGTSYADLTLNGDAVGGGGARSVLLLGACGWHGFITNGEVT